MSIPGAINCPGAELVYRFFENVPSPQTTVVVNCAGRTRSIIGAQSLIDANVPNRVVALRDGTMGWHLAGFKLDRGKDRRAEGPGSRSLSETRALASRRAERAGVENLTSGQCDALLAGDRRTTYLFDVRDPLDYAEGHRCGAVSAPGGQLVQTLDTFAAVHNARFILCDSDGVRAPMTAAWLKQMGIRDVFTVCDDVPTSTGVPVAPKAEALLNDAPVVGLDDAEALRLAGHRVLDLGTSKDYRRAHIAGALFTERHDGKRHRWPHWRQGASHLAGWAARAYRCARTAQPRPSSLGNRGRYGRLDCGWPGRGIRPGQSSRATDRRVLSSLRFNVGGRKRHAGIFGLGEGPA